MCPSDRHSSSSSTPRLAAPNRSVLKVSGGVRTCRQLALPDSILVSLPAGWEGKSCVWAHTERPPAFFGRIKAQPLDSSATGPAALLARLERLGTKWECTGTLPSAKADPIWAKEALTHNTPQHGLWLSLTKQQEPSQAGVLPPHSPPEAGAPPPQTVAGNLPATADGTSCLANEPAGFNSYLPLTLIRASLGHSFVSITSLRLWLRDVNLGPPLGWPPSSQPPTESCCLTVP